MRLSIFSSAYLPSIYLIWKRICSNLLPILLMGCLSYYWVIRVPHDLDVRPLSKMYFANIFFQSVACLFIFLTVSFKKRKVFILVKSNLSIFILWFMLFTSWEIFVQPMVTKIFSYILKVYCFRFYVWSLIHHCRVLTRVIQNFISISKK